MVKLRFEVMFVNSSSPPLGILAKCHYIGCALGHPDHCISIPDVLVMFLLLWWNSTTNTNLGRKGFISSYNSQITLHCWRKSGHEVKAGTLKQKLNRGHEGVLLISSPLMSCLSCLFIKLSTTCPSLVPPTVGCALSHQPLIKKKKKRKKEGMNKGRKKTSSRLVYRPVS